MGDIIDEFGRNAGKVWNALNKHGTLTQTKLIKTTKLKGDEFCAAVGWLARENKIYKDGANYKLGGTNLTYKIGEDAGKVWNALEAWEEIDKAHIQKITGVSEEDVYYALGWLAREGKIDTKKVKPKTTQIKVVRKLGL
jgi:hypothetical protein